MRITNTELELSPMQSTWLITFADLVTLLLCAFLLFFSMTWRKWHAIPQEQISSKVDGTQIAQPVKVEGEKPLSKQGIRLILREADYEDGGEKVPGTFLLKAVNSGLYNASWIEIASCAASPGESAWTVSENRSLALSRQLIDAGVLADRLKLRVVGPYCSTIRKSGEEEAVTVVTGELVPRNG